jgi:hypothetical protein
MKLSGSDILVLVKPDLEDTGNTLFLSPWGLLLFKESNYLDEDAQVFHTERPHEGRERDPGSQLFPLSELGVPNMEVKKVFLSVSSRQILYKQKNHPATLSSDLRTMESDKMWHYLLLGVAYSVAIAKWNTFPTAVPMAAYPLLLASSTLTCLWPCKCCAVSLPHPRLL